MIKINDSIMIKAITIKQMQERFTGDTTKLRVKAIYREMNYDCMCLLLTLASKIVPARVIEVRKVGEYTKMRVAFESEGETVEHWIWGCHIAVVIPDKKKQLHVKDLW